MLSSLAFARIRALSRMAPMRMPTSNPSRARSRVRSSSSVDSQFGFRAAKRAMIGDRCRMPKLIGAAMDGDPAQERKAVHVPAAPSAAAIQFGRGRAQAFGRRNAASVGVMRPALRRNSAAPAPPQIRNPLADFRQVQPRGGGDGASPAPSGMFPGRSGHSASAKAYPFADPEQRFVPASGGNRGRVRYWLQQIRGEASWT